MFFKSAGVTHLFVKPSVFHHRSIGVPLDRVGPLPKVVDFLWRPGWLQTAQEEIILRNDNSEGSSLPVYIIQQSSCK